MISSYAKSALLLLSLLITSISVSASETPPPRGSIISSDDQILAVAKSLKLLEHPMHRANQSYGYGMHATFAQMLKAYSAFNNDGTMVTPRIIDYYTDQSGDRIDPKSTQPTKQPLSKASAGQMRTILIKAVKRGTGTAARHEGLEIGGKTGTAYIVERGVYANKYHSSFYGFADDARGHRYTIGGAGYQGIEAGNVLCFFVCCTGVCRDSGCDGGGGVS